MTNPPPVDLQVAMISVIGVGFTGLIAVVAFFARRLVTTQDKHGETLVEHAKILTRHDLEIELLRRTEYRD